MTDTNPRDLIWRLTEKLDSLHCYYNVPDQSALIAEARDYLDQSVPEEPTDEELLGLINEWPATTGERHDLDGCPEVSLYSVFEDEVLELARAVLARWGK